ncbi:hydrolase [Leuconostoc lactis]|uniref:hydrolase n=1 Tax=Leuconostoc lactis TaxID=1246 RepID=UPI000A026948|nr:hydrolase [Leuconostoc lactis]ORI85407.1 hydrolase [Leuconostoc lactis]ORI87616.1 hydrolase [Leuconostoc lactis]
MTNQDTQTVLQPELINQLDHKILYLGQLQKAISTNQVPLVYELLDSKKYNGQIRQRAHADSNHELANLVADIQQDIAHFLAPELLAYLTVTFDFLRFEQDDENPILYRVYLGDWWHHRQLGVLNVLTITIDYDQKVMAELTQTAQLASGDSLNAAHIQEVNQIIMGLEAFLADDTKRRLELQVLDDQISALQANKSGLFGRNDKATRDNLEKKRELLLATQKRVPEVEKKLAAQQEELLTLEKEDALRQFELQAILSQFETVPAFTTALANSYVAYLTQFSKD